MQALDTAAMQKRVMDVIAESLCVETAEVQPQASLIADLGAESIDLLDIVFRLEKEFDIKIPQREIEQAARSGLKPEEFEINMILQEKGAERLRQLLPEVPTGRIKAGMSIRELPRLFTVEVFINIVGRKLRGEDLPVFTATPTQTETNL